MKVFIDTGAFLAISDNSDNSHSIATKTFHEVIEQNAKFHTSNFVIDETITLIRARVGHKAAESFIKAFNSSNTKQHYVNKDVESRAIDIFTKYRDKDFSFTDCTSFALIDKHRIDAAMSFDKHFSQYGYKHNINHLLL